MNEWEGISPVIPPELPQKPPFAPSSPPEAISTTSFPPMIEKWANAIGHWEGARPASNNEGNLKYSTLTKSWGATQGHPAADGGFFCQFATPEAGHNALCNFLMLGAEYQLIISHPKPCSLRQFTIRFAGNPPEGYIQGIVKLLGVSQDVDIASFLIS